MPETDKTPPVDKDRELQRKQWICAKQSKTGRFHALYDRIYRGDVLWEEWRRVRGNGGAAGVDQTTLRSIEEQGVGQSFEGIQADLKAGEYRTSPVKRQYITKADGRQRPPRGGQGVKQVIAKLNPVLCRLGKVFSEGDVLTGVSQDGPLRLRALVRWL
jgi:RNA-directed DNA polymerase